MAIKQREPKKIKAKIIIDEALDLDNEKRKFPFDINTIANIPNSKSKFNIKAEGHVDLANTQFEISTDYKTILKGLESPNSFKLDGDKIILNERIKIGNWKND